MTITKERFERIIMVYMRYRIGDGPTRIYMKFMYHVLILLELIHYLGNNPQLVRIFLLLDKAEMGTYLYKQQRCLLF